MVCLSVLGIRLKRDKPLKLIVSICLSTYLWQVKTEKYFNFLTASHSAISQRNDWLLSTYNWFASLESSVFGSALLKGVIKRINSLTLMITCNKRLLAHSGVLNTMLFLKKDINAHFFVAKTK